MIKLLIILSLIAFGCEKKIDDKSSKVNTVDSIKDISRDNKELSEVQIGIESIVKNKDLYEIDIYAITSVPIAGLQLDFSPSDIFEIDSIAGGICEQLDFAMHSSPSGTMLGFSMKGTLIPASVSKKIEDNILFTAYARIKRNVKSEQINLSTVIAGSGGVKMNSNNIPFAWSSK